MRSTILAVLFAFFVAHSMRADDANDQLSKDAPTPLTVPFDKATARAAQDAWVKHLGKPERVEKNSLGMELVLIPPGKFMMGSPASEQHRKGNEEQIEVTLTKVFCLGKEEVTQGEWRSVMGTTPWKGRKGREASKQFTKTTTPRRL